MGKRLQYRRVLLLLALLVVAFGGLGYRLVDLQILRHQELSVKARTNTQKELLLEPRRGDILDAKGNLLATSLQVKTVCADPSLMGKYQPEIARALAPILQLNEADLLRKLNPLRENDRHEMATNRYAVLKHKVPTETWTNVVHAMASLTFGMDEKTLTKTERNFYRDLRQKSVFVDPVDDQLRIYPNQSLAAHVLGCVGTTNREFNGLAIAETIGLEGIERTFDDKLRGIRGWRLTETDRQSRELVALREQDVEARDGYNVVLTIDSFIQHVVESALADAMEKHSPISASGLVIRPKTGEILAMATIPTFDPNNPGRAVEARRNRIITDIAEPGSTFKIVVVSGALNDGIVRLNDTFDCEHGHYVFAGKPLHDHEPYGVLTVEGIITHSSNIGAAKIGIRMGANRLSDYIRDYGFGQATGVPLPGEVSARIFVPAVKNWTKVSIAQIPMGQGISTTRMQMAMAMCAIANQGWLMRPMLVDHLEDDQHHVVAKYSPQRVRQVIDEPAAKLMVQALKTVVSTNGTAAKAALTHYVVAGKTGTAQKVENRVYVRKYFSSFIGFFPADNPELCIAVSLDEPRNGYYGGQAAAPVFKEIAERAAAYLNIPPDDAPSAVPVVLSTKTSSEPAVRTAVALPNNHATERQP
jgi:cell division protein FtsI/penicillin-binding protein 2